MKQHLHSYRLLLMVAAICTLAAFWLLGARIGVEQTQRQVDVVISYEDTVRLADASGMPVQEWLTQLADAGVRELLVTPDEQAKPDIVRAAQDAGLMLAQALVPSPWLEAPMARPAAISFLMPKSFSSL